MRRKKILALALSFFIATVTLFGGYYSNIKATTNTVGVTYDGHVQNVGWQPWVSDGQEIGTDGRSLRVEALKIKLVNAPAGASIKYQTHVENIGWQPWVTDGTEAGTDGKGLRVEAIKVQLVNMPGYSIQYQAHVQNVGWQNIVSDGQIAGTSGKGYRIEALRINIVKVSDNNTIGVSYQGHVQNIGWQDPVQNGQLAGTEGQSLRVEALKLNLINAPVGASIQYQGHVQNVGWQPWAYDGQEAGTDGKGFRVEALKIKLVNMPGYSVQYRAHVQNIGWQPWVADGAEAGTDGRSLRIEAIEVRIVTSGTVAPTPTDLNDSAIPPSGYIIGTDNVLPQALLTNNLNPLLARNKQTAFFQALLWMVGQHMATGFEAGNPPDDALTYLEATPLYSYNGANYKMVGMYEQHAYVNSNKIDVVRGTALTLHTEYMTTGFDPTQTFDYCYVNYDCKTKTNSIYRYVVYFAKM